MAKKLYIGYSTSSSFAFCNKMFYHAVEKEYSDCALNEELHLLKGYYSVYHNPNFTKYIILLCNTDMDKLKRTVCPMWQSEARQCLHKLRFER